MAVQTQIRYIESEVNFVMNAMRACKANKNLYTNGKNTYVGDIAYTNYIKVQTKIYNDHDSQLYNFVRANNLGNIINLPNPNWFEMTKNGDGQMNLQYSGQQTQNAERVVISTDCELAFFTNDHYANFDYMNNIIQEYHYNEL